MSKINKKPASNIMVIAMRRKICPPVRRSATLKAFKCERPPPKKAKTLNADKRIFRA